MEDSRASFRSKTPSIMKQKNQIYDRLEQQEQINQIASIWKTKQQRLESDKSIDLLLNRISLLKKEELKTEKRINEAKKKTDDVINKKKEIEDEMRRKLQKKMHDEEFLKFMQNKQLDIRKQQQNERYAIRNALVELKREEREEVKRVSRQNSEKIHGIKLKEIEIKRQKHDYLQHKKQFWKEKVSSFWEEKIQKQHEQNYGKQYEEVKIKLRNDKILEALEKEEYQLIKKLQFSQNLAENALKQLDDAQKLTNQNFINKYRKDRAESVNVNNNFSSVQQNDRYNKYE